VAGWAEDISVSAIIPTYNCAHLLPQAIESAIDQSHKLREIIVVDDGSTDNTEECIHPFLSQIRYIKQENRGLAGARNRGIRESTAAFVAFLDADDIWLFEKTEKQLSAFRSSPDVALTFTDAQVLSPTGKTMPTFMFGKGAREGYVFDLLLRSSFILPSTAMIRRSCFEDVGLFDEGLICVEDLDLWLRICRKYPVKMVAEPLAVWRRQEDGLTAKITNMANGTIQVYRKWLSKSCNLSSEETQIVKHQISKCYFDIGFSLREQSRMSALKNLSLSIGWDSGNLKSWRALVTTLLPARLRELLKGSGLRRNRLQE
jgi:cellulose synthase/poly-beta-1,6-N-acetylglucosamine synthase-like glycosyltransferase